MDNERKGVPPQAPPQITAQQAGRMQEPSSGRASEPQGGGVEAKKKTPAREAMLLSVVVVLLLALATWFIVFALGSGKTPSQAVAEAAEAGFGVQEELVRVSLPGQGERSLFFYISDDELACAILQRGAGGYDVLDISGHLPLTSNDRAGVWMAASMPSSADEYLVFGLLYDPELSSVEVDGIPAVVINTGVYRCWYYLGEGNISINSESVVYS